MTRDKRKCFEVEFEFKCTFAEYDECTIRSYPFADLSDALDKVVELKKAALSMWEDDGCTHFELTIWRYGEDGHVGGSVFTLSSMHGGVWE